MAKARRKRFVTEDAREYKTVKKGKGKSVKDVVDEAKRKAKKK